MKKVFFLFVLAVMAVSCSNNKLNAPDMPISQNVVASAPNPVLVWYDLTLKLAKMDFMEIKEYMLAHDWTVRDVDNTWFTKISDSGITFDYEVDWGNIYTEAGSLSANIWFSDTAMMSVEDVQSAITKIGSSFVINGYHMDFKPDYPYWFNGSLMTEQPTFEELVSMIGQDSDGVTYIEWACNELEDSGRMSVSVRCEDVNGTQYVSSIHFRVLVPGKDYRVAWF